MSVKYKVTDKGKEYIATLSDDVYPYAINFKNDWFVSVTVSKVSQGTVSIENSELIGECDKGSNPVKVTIQQFFPNKEHDLATLKLVSKHKSKNWCLVLIDGKVKGWFETDLLKCD